VPDAVTLAAYRNLLDVDLNWLVNGEGSMFLEVSGGRTSRPKVFGDEARLLRAISTVEIGLSESGRSATPEVRARLIFAAYELSAKESDTHTAQIIQLIKS